VLSYRQKVQMIFQDPYGSLNPVHTVFHHLARPLLIHKKVKKQDELEEQVYAALEGVGLTPAKQTAQKYPYQLSGGQRQRVCIAKTLAIQAEVVLADEPTSALDVSIRLGILNLMQEMKVERKVAFMYITHDIATCRYFTEDIAVMYVGHIVEWGDSMEITTHPQHPYTQLLLSAVPDPKKKGQVQKMDEKEKKDIPMWTPDSSGCPFASRCPHVMKRCADKLPGVTKLADNHFVRCYLHE
jgi:peptide/nickel transport system ATP-binding protein